ncbi:hypothetical protein VII00023_14091 [Vibrio ichthyoenteri ATCC 700023]|uniref:Uncharacterized protein n=1 Tax=Vibrio ichthyoenteri ATCC 700023 TaxID=870968 RepID=F9RXQ5_9VIBR|nr:hypothetical protein VII00023_14091 [Vibrio ichthyoenteri ATCC 700023]
MAAEQDQNIIPILEITPVSGFAPEKESGSLVKTSNGIFILILTAPAKNKRSIVGI